MKKSASYSNSFPTQDWVRETIPRLILMDDAFMRVVLKDMKCTEYILQIVLNKPDLRVKSQNLQMDLKNLQGRSLILDCYCTDKTGTVYNIEIQNGAQGASPLRARYHSGMIDMNILHSGQNFEHLPESYVIFICGKDVLKRNKQIYHISRVIEETGEPFQDKTHIVYLNTNIRDNTELGKLIKDFYITDPKKMHSKVLARRVFELKENNAVEKGEEGTMTSYFERLKKQWKKEAVLEGRAEGRTESETKMAKLMGLLVKDGRIDDIAKASESESFRKSLLEEYQLS